MREYLKKAGRGKKGSRDLTREEAKEAFTTVLEGRATAVQSGAFFAVMRMKGETPEELSGFLDAAREKVSSIEGLEGDFIVDVATSYDGKERSLHILPSALFIAAGSGVKVATHGSTCVPSKEAPTFFDVIKEIGTNGPRTKEIAVKAIKESNFTYYHQSLYSPELYNLLELRRDFNQRTFINVIEKALNPFNLTSTITGIYHEPYFSLQSVLANEGGFKEWTIVKGVEGGLEPHPEGETRVVKTSSEGIESDITVEAAKLGLDIRGHKERYFIPAQAEANSGVLRGEASEVRDWAIYTAALIIYASGKAQSIEEGVETARESLFKGDALRSFLAYRGVAG